MTDSSIGAKNGMRRPDASVSRTRGWPATFFTTLVRCGTGVMRWAASFVRICQVARMMSVLAQMNDTQLAEIGIKRSDVPKYAESLIFNDG